MLDSGDCSKNPNHIEVLNIINIFLLSGYDITYVFKTMVQFQPLRVRSWCWQFYIPGTNILWQRAGQALPDLNVSWSPFLCDVGILRENPQSLEAKSFDPVNLFGEFSHLSCLAELCICPKVTKLAIAQHPVLLMLSAIIFTSHRLCQIPSLLPPETKRKKKNC